MIRNDQMPPFSRRSLVKGAGGVAAVALLSGTTPRTIAAQEMPQTGGTLRFGVSVEPRRMNQLNTTWMTDATQHIFSRLVARDLEGNYVPELASIDVSEDALTWTITLREGIKFHNGDPVTADAVVWWFEKARDPDTLYGFKGSYASVAAAEAIDELTTIVTLHQPDPGLMFMLSTVYSSIHNPRTYEELGDDGYGIQGTDGTGYFKLDEFTPGGTLRIVRNDEYAWAPSVVENQGPPYIDAIEYRFIADAAARSAAVEAGDLDIVVGPNLADIERLQQNSDVIVHTRPAAACRMININCQHEVLGDKRVRQALAHAINRQPIIDRLLFGYGSIASSLVPPIFDQIFLEESVNYFPFDLEAGRALLAEAGLIDNDGDGVVERDGSKLTLEMMVTPDSDLVQLAQVVQAQAAEIGLDIELLQVDVETLAARRAVGDFDVIMGFYSWDAPDTILDWLFNSAGIGSTNFVRLADDQVDELIGQLRVAPTTEERYNIAKEIQRIIHGDLVPLIPIFHPFDIWVTSNRLHGFAPNAYSIIPRLNDAWLG